MKSLAQFIALISLVLMTACSSQQSITEEQVNQLINQADLAAQTMDADSVASMLSEDVTIKLNIHTDEGTQTMQFNKQEYISLLRQGWDVASKYTFTRSNVNINISGDKATVTSDLVDALVIDGTTLKSSNKDTSMLKIVDGKLLITNVFVDSIM